MVSHAYCFIKATLFVIAIRGNIHQMGQNVSFQSHCKGGAVCYSGINILFPYQYLLEKPWILNDE